MMQRIADVEALEALYAHPGEAARKKVQPVVTPLYRDWIDRARFCILSTVGPGGTDASPRGDDGPVVRVVAPDQVRMPDWRGNNRLDSLRNIVSDGRVSLMFLIPGSGNAIRLNGSAILTADPGACAEFDRDGIRPRCVIVIRVAEVYSQCARAILRSGLWSGEDHSAGLPSVGDLLAEAVQGFDAAAYDADWPVRAAGTMW